MISNCNQVLEENHSVRTKVRSAIKWHGFRQPKISKNGSEQLCSHEERNMSTIEQTETVEHLSRAFK